MQVLFFRQGSLHAAKGSVLIALLLLLLIISLLVLQSADQSRLAIQLSQTVWQQTTLVTMTARVMSEQWRQQDILATSACLQPTLLANDYLKKSLDWWQHFAKCQVSDNTSQVFWVTEKLQSQWCVHIASARDEAMGKPVDIYRITAYGRDNSLWLSVFLQSTVIVPSIGGGPCQQPQTVVALGLQSWRQLNY